MKLPALLIGTILLSFSLSVLATHPTTYTSNLQNYAESSFSSLQTDESSPTSTPRPTATPIPTPPPADPGTTNLMVTLSTIIIVIILVGVWLNRRRVA